MDLAERFGMRLFEADCLIEYARLSKVRGDKEGAKEETNKAKELIKETGYKRREAEVRGLSF